MLLQLGAKAVVGIILLILSCCTPSHAGLPKGVSNKFFWMPEKQRNAEFEKYDLDTQYRIYIYGSQQIEPPMIGLAWPLAREGGRIVQPLAAKLESADHDLTIRDIVFVFRVMNDLGTYDVAGDKSLMNKLREKGQRDKGSLLADSNSRYLAGDPGEIAQKVVTIDSSCTGASRGVRLTSQALRSQRRRRLG